MSRTYRNGDTYHENGIGAKHARQYKRLNAKNDRARTRQALNRESYDATDDGADYSPFNRADPRNRLSRTDAPYLRGEPAPLRVLVPVTIEG